MAQPKTPHRPEAFLLDKPVLLNERVWHNVLSPSAVSRIKITENTNVEGKRINFKEKLELALTLQKH